MVGQNSIVNLAMLFASRAGGVLVMLFFIPYFYRLLGAEQFGVVAVILSLQALLMMIDLGMSTMVGRDIAMLGHDSSQAIKTWRNAEAVLTLYYLAILLLAFAWRLVSSAMGLSEISVVLVVMMFWALVLQNLGQTVLLGAKSFKIASTIQLFGALFRASATVISLQHFSATVFVFITAQLLTALIQLIVTRWVCNVALREYLHKSKQVKNEISDCIELVKRGKPLLISGLAGAAVMQLDKPIIAAFNSVQEVSTYFLAVTFCMTPIAVLAGPVVQYFQPSLIACLSKKDQSETRVIIVQFVWMLLLATMLPSAVLWLYRDFWLNLWLGEQPTMAKISSYVMILLPGVAVGSFGYIPVVLLTAAQEYKFQARLALFLAIGTLSAIFIFAWKNSLQLICWVYVSYFILATVASWNRAIKITHMNETSKSTLLLSVKITLTIIVTIAIIYKFTLIAFSEFNI